MVVTKTNLLFLILTLWILQKANAQTCGNCKSRPSIAFFDLDIQVPQPELKGEQTKGWLEWKQLFWLSRHMNANLFQNNKNCIKFVQPSSNDDDLLIIGDIYTNLPSAKRNISQFGNYFITGFVKQSGNNYIMHVELQSSCNRKTVASAEVPFSLSSILQNSESIAQQAAAKLSPLIDKIKNFELEERKQNPGFAIAASNIDLIKITAVKTKLLAGQQTEIKLELKDCDGIALPGKEIIFTEDIIAGLKVPGTVGGIVSPAKVITDANGFAKANFKLTATTGKPAIINAHALTQTPVNCQSALIGSAQVDALPAYKVTVSYIKTAKTDFNMDSDEDGVVFKAGEQKSEEVAYSFSLLYYPEAIPKEGEQIMIIPQFEDHPENDHPNKGKSVVLFNEGYSEYNIIANDLALVRSPVGAPSVKTEPQRQRYFSTKPQPPMASFLFANNNLVFFSAGVEFPEQEEGLNPVSSSFGIEKDNKKYFPLAPKKISDPNSPYKWLYEFEYRNEEGYSKEGKVFSTGRKEIESATILIWKSF